MVQSIGLPFPVFKFRKPYFSPANARYNFLHSIGIYGTTVTPHMILTFNKGGEGKQTVAFSCGGIVKFQFLKFFLVLGYFIWQLYIEKSYLRLAPIEGTSRLQLQHPVKHCNPLDDGCSTDFRTFDKLPYCKQSGRRGKDIARQETCEYFDEFDIKTRGYTHDNMLVPTRETLFDQKVLCGGREARCKDKYSYVDKDTIYVADIESFTLLIDHSLVCPEMQLSYKSWDMVGFYEVCHEGSMNNAAIGHAVGMNTGCKMKPIHRVSDHKSAVGKREEDRAFKMWMEPKWFYTFFPYFGNSMTESVDNITSPFVKIDGGDIISIGDIIKELGLDLDATIKGGDTRRYSGFVVVIDIEYTNFKAFSWPNHLPPIYKYKIKLSPADEYKVMQTKNFKNDNTREVTDSHGIYIIIKSQGCLGLCSWMYICVMCVGALALEGFARYLVTMYALHKYGAEKKDGDQQTEKDLEFHIAREIDVPTFAGVGPSDEQNGYLRVGGQS